MFQLSGVHHKGSPEILPWIKGALSSSEPDKPRRTNLGALIVRIGFRFKGSIRVTIRATIGNEYKGLVTSRIVKLLGCTIP